LGRFNNVDLRDGFSWGGEERVLVAATDRTNIALALFLLDPATGEAAPAPGGLIPLSDVVDPYGVCLSKSADGVFTALATGTEGEIRQFSVREEGGQIVARESRRGEMGSITEGCVFDDRTGEVFLAQEEVGIWRLAAGAAVDAKVMLHPIDDKALVADVEGLTIHVQGEDGGFLVASSQGDSAYAVFALPDGRYVGRFVVVDGAVDGTSETDGLDATSRPLPGFPRGLLVIQDDEDDQGGQNFKLVDWADIAAALALE
jgi:3-phytase